jgi:hypothetical protein
MKSNIHERSDWSGTTFFWYVVATIIICTLAHLLMGVEWISTLMAVIFASIILSGAMHSRLIQFNIP